MNDFHLWHYDTLGTKAVEALTKNNFKATYVKSRQEAIGQILALIPPDATVGIAGSWTIREIGLHTKIEEQGNVIYDHGKPGISLNDSMPIRRNELVADVFLTGTNAITLDGKLVNVDGFGNRVAAMIFGPKKTIVVAGVNKIVRNVDEAERRIETVAAPLNAKRLNRPTPCTQTGICQDCQSPGRICNVTTIIRKNIPAADMHIFIIGEQLGF